MRCGGTEIVMEQKIKQDKIQIGKNIRRIRKQNKLKQTDMVVRLQLMGMDMTREALVKIERGIQHIYASQLKAIKEVLGTTYDELLSDGQQRGKMKDITYYLHWGEDTCLYQSCVGLWRRISV